MKRQTLQEQCLTELLRLDEANRTSLIAQSRNAGAYKNQERGKNRFDRKRYSKIANAVKSYNEINMNSLFKQDILQVNIPVIGENDEYTVTIKLEGIVGEIHKNIKNNNNKLEYRTIIQALTKIFNTSDVYIKCTCLTGDTKIKLLNGTSDTIENLTKRYNSGEKLYVYAVDEKGDFKPGEVSKVWQTGTTNKLVKVTLDNGEVIKTTQDHLYMLRDGSYASADALEVGQSLMPLYTSTTKNGYETVKFNSTGKYHSTYKVVGEHYYADKITEKATQAKQDKIEGKDKMRYDVAIHHKDFDKANNYPENLKIMTGYEHWLYHAKTIERLWADPEFRKATSKRSSEWMTGLNQNPTEAMRKARRSQKNIEQITAHNYDPKWLEKHTAAMSDFMKEYWKNLSSHERKRRSLLQSDITKAAWERGCFNTAKRKEADLKHKTALHTTEMERLAAEGVRRYWANLEGKEREAVIAQRKANLANGAGWNRGKHLTEEDRKNKRIAALNRTQEEKQAHALKIRNTKMLRVFNKIIEEHKELTAENYEYYRVHFFPKSPRLAKHFTDIEEAVSYFKLNHKIVKIEEINLDESIPVYDITVKNFHNFAVDAGVILHNCDDFKYRFAHWNILKNVSVDDSSQDPGPGKGIANPNDDKGRGCKHMLLVLANGDWMMKVASVINNYCHFLSEKRPDAFLKLVFPKLYGVPADEAEQNGIVEDNEDLETGKDLIDIINEYGRNRGKFKKGSNKNPVTGTGGKAKKEVEEPNENTNKEKPKEEETAEEEADE
jgi:hypothetical protein